MSQRPSDRPMQNEAYPRIAKTTIKMLKFGIERLEPNELYFIHTPTPGCTDPAETVRLNWDHSKQSSTTNVLAEILCVDSDAQKNLKDLLVRACLPRLKLTSNSKKQNSEHKNHFNNKFPLINTSVGIISNYRRPKYQCKKYVSCRSSN